MINNTNVENKHTTNGVLATVYPITFQGAATDSGTPHLRVMLKTADGTSIRRLVYNVDYELVREEIDPTVPQTESMSVPPVVGIKLLNAEDATAGNSLTITRETPFVQDVDFQVGRIDPEQVESTADLSVLRDQELSLKTDKTNDKADEAIETAEEAKEIAEGAEEVADEAKEIAEGIDAKAQQALDNSVEALETAEEAKELAEDTAETVGTFDTRITQAEQNATDAKSIAQTTSGNLTTHTGNTNNPHQVTKAQIGLGNVDNTSDLNKPVSTATQNFVNSSIATSTATFRGTYNSLTELEAVTADENDYGFVVATDSAGNTVYNRYKYTTATTPASWVFEYALNNSSFTAQQWASINSGVTTSDVSKARSAVQPADLGNGTITITQGGTTKGTFTTNQGGNTTIDIDAGGGGSGLNVGDIFYTMRNDNELNGAVECDGATYNTTDFTGAESIGALLEAGKIDYISLTAYADAITQKGWCDKIGWNGPGNTQFRVPTLNAYIWQKLQTGVVGDGTPLGFNYNGNKAIINAHAESLGNNKGWVKARVNGSDTNVGDLAVSTDATQSGLLAGASTDISQQRVMIQLATSATDQALETCTGVLADVAALKYDYVVDFQAPTASNNYTWYRKYKSGWVEQGGVTATNTGGSSVTLPVTMADTNYSIMATILNVSSHQGTGGYEKCPGPSNVATTGFWLDQPSNADYCTRWQVSGMSAS